MSETTGGAGEEHAADVVVVGGGQAGLAVGYYLRRLERPFAILDERERPGGAWLQAWESLRLFSPAAYSSLPGWLMRGGPDDYPARAEVIDYLTRYEERYGFPIHRPVRVSAVRRERERLRVETHRGPWLARAVVSATGLRPYVPEYPGRERFRGVQVHSSEYRAPEDFTGKRVLVVGGGNSGAQVLAELSLVSDTTWVTPEEPRFLPDHVDGRHLFDEASAMWRAQQEGREAPPADDVIGIVMVPPVREARDRGALRSVRPFVQMTEGGVVWPDGREERVDAVVWCTGFQPALEHLRPLGLLGPGGRVEVRGTRSVREPRLWLVGYGEWTGFASATLIGVGRTARAAAAEIGGMLTARP